MGLLSIFRGRSKHSGTQADNLRLWCVRRWIHLMPYDELAGVTEQKRMYKLMDEAYGKLSKAMIDTFYEHNEESAR